MSIYHHGNRSIAYQIVPVAFAYDWVMLQDSKAAQTVWNPLIAALGTAKPSRGRMIILDWFDANLDTASLVEDGVRMMRTLGLQTVKLVACGDAGALAKELRRLHSDLVEGQLLYPGVMPDAGELSAAMRDSSQI